jgi:hypothetical protein
MEFPEAEAFPSTQSRSAFPLTLSSIVVGRTHPLVQSRTANASIRRPISLRPFVAIPYKLTIAQIYQYTSSGLSYSPSFLLKTQSLGV